MAIRIMLDAGHYAKTNWSPCKTTPKYYESLMTWDLTNYLKAELETYGFEVGTTRAVQTKDLGVYKRGQKAKGYDLFISIHSNATGYGEIVESVDRPVIIYPINNSKAAAMAPLFGACVKETMGTKNNYKCYSKAKTSNPKEDYYGVIRGAVQSGCHMAFIIEHSFHTNTRSTKWLLDNNNLKKMAEAEAAVIAKYYGYKKDGTPDNKPADTKPVEDNTSKGGCKVELTILKNGSKGDQVVALQTLLNGYGFSCGNADGIFGPKTLAAVKKYQTKHKLDVDGCVGPATWSKLLGVK